MYRSRYDKSFINCPRRIHVPRDLKENRPMTIMSPLTLCVLGTGDPGPLLIGHTRTDRRSNVNKGVPSELLPIDGGAFSQGGGTL